MTSLYMDHISLNLENVLQRLKEYNISLNPKKTNIGLPRIEYVGHTIRGEGISILAERRA